MRKAAAATATRAVTGRSATGPKRRVTAPPPPPAVRGAAARMPVGRAVPPAPEPKPGPARLELVQPPAPAAVEPESSNPFLGLLKAKRRELTGNLEETKFDTLAKMGRVAEDDQAQISHEEFISLQRNSMDYQALRQVNAAIERVNSGEYGICASCEEPISEKRLKAIPWPKYCVSCQDRVQLSGAAEDSEAAEDPDSGSW